MYLTEPQRDALLSALPPLLNTLVRARGQLFSLLDTATSWLDSDPAESGSVITAAADTVDSLLDVLGDASMLLDAARSGVLPVDAERELLAVLAVQVGSVELLAAAGDIQFSAMVSLVLRLGDLLPSHARGRPRQRFDASLRELLAGSEVFAGAPEGLLDVVLAAATSYNDVVALADQLTLSSAA